MIKGNPCKVSDVSTSKTGKHGHAKCHFVAIDIFTGKKMEDLVPAGHTTAIPFVKKEEYQCIDADDDDFVTVMDSKGETCAVARRLYARARVPQPKWGCIGCRSRRMPPHAAACRRMPPHAAACSRMPPQLLLRRRHMPARRHAAAEPGRPPLTDLNRLTPAPSASRRNVCAAARTSSSRTPPRDSRRSRTLRRRSAKESRNCWRRRRTFTSSCSRLAASR